MQDEFEIPSLPQEETKKMKLNKNILAFIGIGLITLIVLGFLGYQYIAPFGTKVIYQFNQNQNKDKVSSINGATPSENIDNNARNTLTIPQQIIRSNIVTFNLKLLSQKIAGVWVKLKFKGDPGEIKIGVRGSENENYQYQPLYNRILNSLPWSQTANGKTTLWQREKKYQDISELVNKLPISNYTKVASYFYNLSDIVMKEHSSLSQSNLKIEKTLRGTHTLLVKVDKKPLLLTVVKQDANAYKGEDELLIQIYNGQNKIAEQLVPDDGITDASGLMMAPQKSEIKINDIKPGIYRIALSDMTKNADTRIKSIEVNQPSLVFQVPVFVVDEKLTTLWTNSRKITLRTQHAMGVQTVRLDGKYDLKVEKEGQDFAFDLTNPESKAATPSAETISALHKLEVPKNDLIINGDGYFSFSEESFFNPEPIKTVDLSTVTDISSIDYIIANYQKVKKDGDWNIAQVYFDAKDIKIDGDKLYFSLESPGLSEDNGEIAIDSLEVTVDKPGWFDSANKNSINTPTPIATATKKSAGLLDRIVNFFKNLWPFKSATHSTSSGQAGEKPKPTNTPTPTPTLKEKLKISVQNGGAVEGAAGKYADLLKTAGFKNVDTANATNSAFKNATISYNKAQEGELESTLSQIETILNKDYETVNKITTADKDKINIILGQIPKPTPTPIKSGPTATPSTTIKP